MRLCVDHRPLAPKTKEIKHIFAIDLRPDSYDSVRRRSIGFYIVIAHLFGVGLLSGYGKKRDYLTVNGFRGLT